MTPEVQREGDGSTELGRVGEERGELTRGGQELLGFSSCHSADGQGVSGKGNFSRRSICLWVSNLDRPGG